jgi:hypothetical protein
LNLSPPVATKDSGSIGGDLRGRFRSIDHAAGIMLQAAQAPPEPWHNACHKRAGRNVVVSGRFTPHFRYHPQT